MKELGNSNSRRAFIPKEDRRRRSSSYSSHARDYSKLSYLISITIPQPKLGIKIPKSLVNNMRNISKFHRVNNHDHDHTEQTNNNNKKKKKKKWTEKLLPKKGASIFSKLFRSKKKSTSSKNGCFCNQVEVNGLHDFCSLLVEGTTTSEEEEEEDYHHRDDHHHQPPFQVEEKRSNKVQPDHKLSLPLADFFNKEKNENNNKNSNGLRVIGRQESSRNLVRVPSRKSTSGRRKLRIAIYVKKMGNNNKTAVRSEEKDGQELCKKRILMGGKCKPLNLSGTLHYDNNGILLPEAIGD